MMVGIRELKSRLSEYLDRVAEGEIITITERGRPKALLIGIDNRSNLQKGIAEGWVKPARRTGLPPIKGWRSHLRTIDVLNEDRGE